MAHPDLGLWPGPGHLGNFGEFCVRVLHFVDFVLQSPSVFITFGRRGLGLCPGVWAWPFGVFFVFCIWSGELFCFFIAKPYVFYHFLDFREGSRGRKRLYASHIGALIVPAHSLNRKGLVCMCAAHC